WCYDDDDGSGGATMVVVAAWSREAVGGVRVVSGGTLLVLAGNFAGKVFRRTAAGGGRGWFPAAGNHGEGEMYKRVESMKEKSTNFVTPTKASGEAQEEEMSPTILEASKTLSKVASQSVSKEKSTDKGKRYRRKAREEINTGIEEVSTGSTKVDSGTTSKRGQREGKAPMVEEDIQATHKTKLQMRQEEAGLEEAIKLQAQLDEEVAKQIHLDKMIAKRMAKEEALTEQQKKIKSQVQFEAQFYTEED
ncbi:hypothetical protein Tco_1263667, partial [Tanacetum coccineum]